MIKVLIVDDSFFVRKTLSTILSQDKEIEVVGTAGDGLQAIAMAKELSPDIITMDIEMPRMDGLSALQKIMGENPCPVIMLSSLTTEGATVALQALEHGALDYMGKPGSFSIDTDSTQKDLINKIKILARKKPFMQLMHKKNLGQNIPPQVQPKVEMLSCKIGINQPSFTANATKTILTKEIRETSTRSLPEPRASFGLVCIGVSTGGPPAVQQIFSQLPSNFPAPIVVAQHMPEAFTGPFAERLDKQSAIKVVEATEAVKLEAGTAYICRGGKCIRIELRAGIPYGVIMDCPKGTIYKPSVNELMDSAAVMGNRVLGVMLTGMGSDGLEGAKHLKARGGKLLAQSEESCVVYGMPKAIVDANIADEIVSIDKMGNTVLSYFCN